MFGNLFKTEETKAREGLESHYQKVMSFVAENDLHEAWEKTRNIIFRNMEVRSYITQNGAFDRNDFYYKSAKEKLIQSAFTSYRGRLRKRKIKHAKPVAEAVAA
ncbi:hypothetical protein M4K89_004152 [Escherichia coli]|uniref:hypothetical protein n=1 Tax=Escherichia coli TaxID=562 RepID=UPI003CF33BC2|nr:hypothetical protein [Escherichia coli]EJE0575935.1 hypothetical protein [Escherichia coli]HDC9157031.1 hypothetical protein [Escherichia coli]